MEPKYIPNNSKEKLKSIYSNNKLRNVKSNFILKIIFAYIPKRKLIEFINNNKYIQRRIDINIDNYKAYSEIYSLIEIEITPKKKEIGRFINIKKEENKKYYLI